MELADLWPLAAFIIDLDKVRRVWRYLGRPYVGRHRGLWLGGRGYR